MGLEKIPDRRPEHLKRKDFKAMSLPECLQKQAELEKAIAALERVGMRAGGATQKLQEELATLQIQEAAIREKPVA